MQRNPYWPLVFSVLKFRHCVLSRCIKVDRLRVKFRGADGKPTTESSKETGETGPSKFRSLVANLMVAGTPQGEFPMVSMT